MLADGEGGSKGKTSERRRQQNRQAQRAFRERKEKVSTNPGWLAGYHDQLADTRYAAQHLKELEDRVFSLEQQSQDQTTENSALKQLLERYVTSSLHPRRRQGD